MLIQSSQSLPESRHPAIYPGPLHVRVAACIKHRSLERGHAGDACALQDCPCIGAVSENQTGRLLRASKACWLRRGGERGTARPEVLQSLLKTTERVVQEIDSVEYGLTDIQAGHLPC
jgi:hypothetical protein